MPHACAAAAARRLQCWRSLNAAKRTIQAMQDGSERLRYPLDETAQGVFKALTHSEKARADLVRAASGLGWWIDRRE